MIQSQLIGKCLWDYVERAKLESDDDIVGNESAKHLIYISMEPSQIAATGVCNTAHDLWMKIRENHEGAEANLQSTSLAEFLGFKYRKNESLISYAGSLELTLGKLEATNYAVDERTKLWVFSNSLPQHLKQTVHMFNMANPNGKVGELISQLKIQHHMDAQESSQGTSAFHIDDSSKGDRNQNNRFRQQPRDNRRPANSFNNTRNNVPNYNMSSNTSNYRSNNYVSGNKQHNNTNSSQGNQITCTFCKISGHLWKECRKLKAENERKKKFGQQRQRDQMRRPQQAPQQNKPSAFTAKAHEFSEGKYSWIVDSGASSHIN